MENPFPEGSHFWRLVEEGRLEVWYDPGEGKYRAQIAGLMQPWGAGRNPHEALRDYCQKIRGEVILLPHKSQQEARIPKTLRSNHE